MFPNKYDMEQCIYWFTREEVQTKISTQVAVSNTTNVKNMYLQSGSVLFMSTKNLLSM